MLYAMDIISTAAQASKSPEPEHEPDTPTRIQPGKPVMPFSNGVLKRHRQSTPATEVVTYRECLKNHAASIGGHALDGCGEFMPSPSATTSDPTSLKCAACGCHRNFHRRDPDNKLHPPLIPPPPSIMPAIEYHPHHRHHPPPPRSPNSASPPPISSSYAPHMLLALSSGLPSAHDNPPPPHPTAMISPGSSSRKRFRTKFSQTQKERMLEFAERVGWKIQKRDEDLIQEFCSEVGVERTVLKVWMHNNKNTLAKRDTNQVTVNGGDGDLNANGGGSSRSAGEDHSSQPHVGANGSSSSS
ncbi:hypothetical protein SAY87_004826 [Trapa incisa]|uniref:ZF-HD dimerization-type domain-containing protein n=1 Tax=Trapa incisa TaxID=236973 RepID=A0AAN7JPU8_9MYRT|nr:hypothetical protein SAY87_004826 [Trapa incisa]